jgi:hypothetical protein
MLNDAEVNPTARLVDWRDQVMMATHEFTREAVIAATDVLYAAHDLQPPNVIFCDGPLHMAALICLVSRLQNCSFWNSCTLNFERSAEPATNFDWLRIFGDTVKPLLETSPLCFLMPDGTGWGALGLSLYRTIFGNPGRIVQHIQTMQTRGFGDAAIQLGYVLENSNPGIVRDQNRIEMLGSRRFIPDVVQAGVRETHGNVAFNNTQRAQTLPFSNWLLDFWIAKPELQSALRPEWLAELDALISLAFNCYSVFFTTDSAFVCRKPTQLHVDAIGRLHNTQQPAITFADGLQVNALSGIRIPHAYIPAHNLSVQMILDEQNVEVRFALIDAFGPQRFLYEYGGTLVDSSEYGELYRTSIFGAEDLMMVRVRNSTPEPDGSYKWYCLRVPPQMNSAREAIAWTFGLSEEQYAPKKET